MRIPQWICETARVVGVLSATVIMVNFAVLCRLIIPVVRDSEK